MAKAQYVLIASLFLAGFSFAQESFVGRVVGVTDGDTITVMREGKGTRVRLHGIDAPEKNQAYGSKAKEFLSKLVFGTDVCVNVVDIDRWGRLVGKVETSYGDSVNEALVENGFAWWYRRYAPSDYTLAKLEVNAQKQKHGLWADPNPTPPWLFRRSKSR
jgi:micrococcal nuclease